MRLGLIGLGRIGAFHAETLIGLPGVESLVVTDPLPAAVDRVTAMFDVDTAGTADELLRAGVDGVVIAADTNAHPQLILAAVEAAVPVFCEKPVARDAQEAVAVLRRVEEAGWIAEACTRSLREHRPVRIEEVRLETATA